MTAFEQQGSSFYHGFSANLKRRFAAGLTLDTSYTWSHTIDDGTNELFTSFINPRRPESPLGGFGNERSTSALDRTNRFVYVPALVLLLLPSWESSHRHVDSERAGASPNPAAIA